MTAQQAFKNSRSVIESEDNVDYLFNRLLAQINKVSQQGTVLFGPRNLLNKCSEKTLSKLKYKLTNKGFDVQTNVTTRQGSKLPMTIGWKHLFPSGYFTENRPAYHDYTN